MNVWIKFSIIGVTSICGTYHLCNKICSIPTTCEKNIVQPLLKKKLLLLKKISLLHKEGSFMKKF